ncbi:flagellar hook-associated protein FlgK [Vibrio ponticus]|nr:flagellar hook-associated protein FlgK [Vibrio ponticus]
MGVHVDNVRRSWDQFAVNELNISTTNFANRHDNEEDLHILSGLLSSVASQKIPENMNGWFDAVKSLADSPMIWAHVKWCWKKLGLSPRT